MAKPKPKPAADERPIVEPQTDHQVPDYSSAVVLRGLSKKSAQTLDIILTYLSRGYSKARACREAGITTRTLASWRADDPIFGQACKDAIEAGTDLFEDEARRRSVEGTLRPVYQQGACVGHVREFSDTLMQTMLAGRRPEVYSKQRHELTGPAGGDLKVEIEFVDPKQERK